jgi:phosphoglycolate phosphatase
MIRRALVLDLDGTLVDSVPDLAACANAVLAERGAAPLGEDEVRHMVGDGIAALVARALAARGLQPDASAKRRFLDLYLAAPTARTRPYPGVPETLDELRRRGARLAICTNKPEAATRAVLAGTGLLGFFEAVLGGDSLPVRKPDPGHLLGALARLGADPGEALMIGDGENDAAAAKAAGVPVVLMRYGYSRVPVESLGADAVLDRFPALLELPMLL